MKRLGKVDWTKSFDLVCASQVLGSSAMPRALSPPDVPGGDVPLDVIQVAAGVPPFLERERGIESERERGRQRERER